MTDILKSINEAVAQKNWYAALFAALSIPDICGKIDDPTKASSARYVQWYDKYILHKYQSQVGPTRKDVTFLSGNDCYALRCAYLHEGSGSIMEQRSREALERFHFTIPRNGVSMHCNKIGNALQLQIDKFCQDIVDGANQWLNDVQDDADVQQKLTGILKMYDF